MQTAKVSSVWTESMCNKWLTYRQTSILTLKLKVIKILNRPKRKANCTNLASLVRKSHIGTLANYANGTQASAQQTEQTKTQVYAL